MSQVVWLIGGSSGIGLELTKKFLENEARVIVSARTASTSEVLSSLQEIYYERLFILDIDVSKSHSVIDSTSRAWIHFGGIDLCIYNAGIYESMRVEEWNLEHFEAMNQVNYMGVLRVLTQIVPLFQERKKGHIAFNASISSYFGLPFGGGYSAPKAALLNFCESIKPELDRKNIHLQVINHGFVKTRLTAKNSFEMPQLLEPKAAAEKIYKGLKDSKCFEIKFPWAISTFLHLLRVLPYRLAFYFTKKAL